MRKGVPFRKAHHTVGSVVAVAEKSGRPLDRLTVEEFQAVSASFGRDVLRVFDLSEATRRRNLIGAPGNREVRRQLRKWKKILRR